MANILDYLDWFGDIPFEQVPFNELDALVLAQLSYVNFTDVIPVIDSGESITVQDASNKFFDMYNKQDLYQARGLISPYTPFLLQKMAKGSRYKDQRLSNLASIIDKQNHEQFAAFCVHLPHDTTYISYRGTDGTLVGWREDFMMSLKEVPAQKEALEYFQSIANRLDGTFMLGGHSKGGNLAAYAATMASISLQDRIDTVWCMDSPGFDSNVIPTDKMMCITDKIKLYVPEFCLVGALMEQQATPTVIYSTQTGVVQHDAMSWQCMGTKFIRKDKCSDAALKVQQDINTIAQSRDAKGKEKLTNSVFDGLQASGANKLGDLLDCSTEDYKKMFSALSKIEGEDVDTIVKLVGSLFVFSINSVVAPIHGKIEQAKDRRQLPTQEEVSAEGLKQYRETKLLRDMQSSIVKLFNKNEEDQDQNEIQKRDPIE